MPLVELEFDIPEKPLQPAVQQWIATSRERLDEYWDQFRHKPLPQYIECDFELVAAGIEHCVERELLDGRLFVEWGCGFGVVTGIAALSGLDAVGIEAEEFLCEEARKLLQRGGVEADIWHGNFLPGGAKRLADDTDPLVSLTHDNPPAYGLNDMDIEDFALIFAYPWPGEEHFIRLVFDRHARPGAWMLMYRGPYHIELYRKR